MAVEKTADEDSLRVRGGNKSLGRMCEAAIPERAPSKSNLSIFIHWVYKESDGAQCYRSYRTDRY